MNDPKFWWLVIVSIVSAGGWLFTFFTRRGAATASDIREAESVVARLRERLARVEEKLLNLPDHDDFRNVERNLAELSGRIEGMDANLERVTNYLLNGSKA